MTGQIKHAHYFILVALVTTALLSSKVQALDVYGEAGVGFMKTSISSTSFRMSAAEARVGAYVTKGLGVELHAAKGVGSDTVNAIEVELDYSTSIQARFETPEKDGGRLFMLLGYGQTSLDMNRSNTGKPGADDFKSGNFGGGAEYHFSKLPGLHLNIKWNRLYAQGGVEIDCTSLGLRFTY